MNTTKKGTALELATLDYFKQEINQGRSFIRKDCYEIYHKKKYFSQARNNYIEFDVAIELFNPDDNQFSALFLIECKNYNSPVPVNDIEEFYAKFDQIKPGKSWGVVVSTNSFQEGAIRFAESKGIGLLRFFDQSKAKWILRRSPSTTLTSPPLIKEQMIASKGIITEDFNSQIYDWYCFSKGYYTNNINTFISKLIETEHGDIPPELVPCLNLFIEQNINVVRQSKAQIEALAQKLHKEIGYTKGEVNYRNVDAYLLSHYKISICFSSSSDGDNHTAKLGMINFELPEIVIFSNNHFNDHHIRYTWAHEIGHVLLGHAQYMHSEFCLHEDIEMEDTSDIQPQDIEELERQANYFAACLLLPRNRFAIEFQRIAENFGIRDRGFGPLYLDDQHCNQTNFRYITNRLMKYFNVSRTAIKYRMLELGLLTESTNNIIRPFGSSRFK